MVSAAVVLGTTGVSAMTRLGLPGLITLTRLSGFEALPAGDDRLIKQVECVLQVQQSSDEVRRGDGAVDMVPQRIALGVALLRNMMLLQI